MSEPTLPRARRETSDVPMSFAPLAFGGMALTVVGLALLALWLYPQAPSMNRMGTNLPVPPSPQLQSDPSLQMTQFSAQETQWLNSAGWVDEAHGISHIPIQDAMRRVARDGVKDWPAK